MLWLCLRLPALPLEYFSCHMQQDPITATTPWCTRATEQRRDTHKNKPAIFDNVNTKTAPTHTTTWDQATLHREQSIQIIQELLSTLHKTSWPISTYKNSFMINVSNTAKQRWGLQTQIREIKQHAKCYGHTIDTGVAATPKAAYMFATHFRNQSLCVNENPSYYDRRQLKQFLGQLPLSVLDTPEHQPRFQQLGLNSIADVMALPITTIAKQFGTDLVIRLGQLHGDIQDPQKAILPPTAAIKQQQSNQRPNTQRHNTQHHNHIHQCIPIQRVAPDQKVRHPRYGPATKKAPTNTNNVHLLRYSSH